MPESRSPVKRSPGRPKGSKNRPKSTPVDSELLLDEETEETTETTVSATEDLSDVTFSHRAEPDRTTEAPTVTPSSESKSEPISVPVSEASTERRPLPINPTSPEGALLQRPLLPRRPLPPQMQQVNPGDPVPEGDEEAVYDPETQARYEEVKRGAMYITELQQMSMQQLIKIAKDEGINEYTG
ncbi:MAG TPA: hypothetical protein PLN21_22730, partial [Gemmatales bacterium]|nr:hypothetical protein [Gemmatales bacterium]